MNFIRGGSKYFERSSADKAIIGQWNLNIDKA